MRGGPYGRRLLSNLSIHVLPGDIHGLIDSIDHHLWTTVLNAVSRIGNDLVHAARGHRRDIQMQFRERPLY
jgi:hypothetical protein